jgi:predicted transcriptional regulator
LAGVTEPGKKGFQPKTYTRKAKQFRIDTKVDRWLTQRAQAYRCSRSEIVNDILLRQIYAEEADQEALRKRQATKEAGTDETTTGHDNPGAP